MMMCSDNVDMLLILSPPSYVSCQMEFKTSQGSILIDSCQDVSLIDGLYHTATSIHGNNGTTGYAIIIIYTTKHGISKLN